MTYLERVICAWRYLAAALHGSTPYPCIADRSQPVRPDLEQRKACASPARKRLRSDWAIFHLCVSCRAKKCAMSGYGEYLMSIYQSFKN